MVHGRGDGAEAPAGAVERDDLPPVRELPRDDVAALDAGGAQAAGDRVADGVARAACVVQAARRAVDRVRGSTSQVEGDLDGAGLALVDERLERVAPLVEPERVGEQAGRSMRPSATRSR